MVNEAEIVQQGGQRGHVLGLAALVDAAPAVGLRGAFVDDGLDGREKEGST